MTLFCRNVTIQDYRVTVNGREVRSWVVASEEGGYVYTQDFPPDWVMGCPMPPEKTLEGVVRIERLSS